MAKTCFAQSDGNDSDALWYSAASGGSPVTPASGDTLDTNGHALTAGATLAAGQTYTVVDAHGGGTLTVPSGQVLFCLWTVGPGGNVVFGDTNGGAAQYGTIFCRGGHVSFINGGNQGSLLVCGNSGTVLLDASTNWGQITVEAGGSVTLDSTSGTSANQAGITIEEGGTVALTNGSANNSSIVCEGGSVNFDATSTSGATIVCESNGQVNVADGGNVGLVACYTGGIVTGSVTYLIAINAEKHTTHYSVPNGSTGLGDEIAILNDTKTLFCQGGPHMTDCVPANIVAGKTIAGVAGMAPAGGADWNPYLLIP